MSQKESASVRIDKNLCTGCGLCVRLCPSDALTLHEGAATMSGECIMCGHCHALCPEAAVSVPGLGPGGGDFATFRCPEEWLPWGGNDPGRLAQLMRSRRSCRVYSDKPVDQAVLEDVVRFGVSAPSGTASQRWSFTVLPDRASVLALGNAVGDYFRRLNRTAERGWLRMLLRLAGRGELDWYWREYYPRVKSALEQWDQDGTDRLFHGAPAAIIVASRPGSSCPAEDALLASQNMLLGAHALGLGSCLIGYAVTAMQRDGRVQAAVGLDPDETVYAVAVLGWPSASFARQALRKPFSLRTFKA